MKLRVLIIGLSLALTTGIVFWWGYRPSPPAVSKESEAAPAVTSAGPEEWIAGVEAATRSGSIPEQGWHLDRLARSVSAEQWDNAWIAARNISDGSLQLRFRRALLDRFLVTDPERAVAHALELADAALLLPLFKNGFRAWAEKDPSAALHYFEALAPGAVKKAARNALIAGLANPNRLGGAPSKAAARAELLIALVSRESLHDPAELLAELDSLSTSPLRSEAMKVAITAWALNDPAAAWRQLNLSRESSDRAALLPAILRQWAVRDPDRAASALEQISASRERQQLVATVGAEWSKQDPAAAVLWLRRQEGALPALRSAFGVWSQRDPHAAAQAAQSVPAVDQPHIVSLVGQEWAALDPQAALQWAQSVANASARPQAIAAVLQTWSMVEPARAALALEQLADPAPSEIVLNVLSQWSSQDPAAAAGWIEKGAVGTSREAAIQTVMAAWAPRDALAAEAWLSQLPRESDQQTAIAAYVSFLSGHDPAAAARWVPRITDASARLERLHSLIKSWQEKDRAAADAWLTTANFPAAEKANFLVRP